MKLPTLIYVLNRGQHELRDRFDGEDYVFPPNTAVQIPSDAAKLIFGFGEEDKIRAIQRLGWARTTNDLELARQRLGEFQFHVEPPPNVHQTAPVVVTDPKPDSEPKASQGGGEGNDDEGSGLIATPPAATNLLAKLGQVGATAGG